MSFRILSVALVSATLSFFALGLGSASAQSDFFFSFDQEGPNTDQSRDFNVGDSGSVWIYWSTNGPADSDLNVGAFIDVFTSTSDVIEFTAAETFDYDIRTTSTGQLVGTRLQSAGHGPVDVSEDFIDELAAFVVNGFGILESNNGSSVFIDAGYSANNDGFEWGRIDFNVIGEGTTSVTGTAGDGMIVNGASIVDAAFSTVTINATSQIPEPTFVGLLAVGITGMMARRRHHKPSAECHENVPS